RGGLERSGLREPLPLRRRTVRLRPLDEVARHRNLVARGRPRRRGRARGHRLAQVTWGEIEMKPFIRALVLVVGLAGCRGGGAPGGVEAARSELDFETGTAQGSILWQGAPAGAAETKGLILFEASALDVHLTGSSYSVTLLPGDH